MKRKGTILSIICFTLVLLNIVPLFSYAGNGQCAYKIGNGNSFDTDGRGFINPIPYVNDESGLNFTLSFIQSVTASLYLVSVYEDTAFNTWSSRLYIEHIHEVDLLNTFYGYGNGSHYIDISALRIPVGGYKLIAIVNENDPINADIYEYYFVYTGYTTFLIGDGAVRSDSLYTITEFVDGVQVSKPVVNAPYNNIMTYTGTLTPLSIDAQTIRVSIKLGKWITYERAKVDYYDIWFKELACNVTTNDGYYTAEHCTVYLYNQTKRVLSFIGCINNITRINHTSSLMSYPLYFDDSLVSQGDILEIQLNFYYYPDTRHVGTQFDYTVTCNNIAISAYEDKSRDEVFNSLDDLENAGNALSNVERPNINFDDLDINDIIGTESLTSASSYFDSLYSYEIIGIMLMVVAILVLLSYLFFGKK